MTTFTFDVQKLSSYALTAIMQHNARYGSHEMTKSKLKEDQWFNPKGAINFVQCSKERLSKLRSIKQRNGDKQRKDAILAVSLLFQIGDSYDYRGEDGKIKKDEDWPVSLNEMKKAIFKQVEAIYGKDAILQADVHLDEQSPHFHVIVSAEGPDGFLNAKEMTSRLNLKKNRRAFYNELKKIAPDLEYDSKKVSAGQKHNPNLGAVRIFEQLGLAASFYKDNAKLKEKVEQLDLVIFNLKKQKNIDVKKAETMIAEKMKAIIDELQNENSELKSELEAIKTHPNFCLVQAPVFDKGAIAQASVEVDQKQKAADAGKPANTLNPMVAAAGVRHARQSSDYKGPGL